jgi:ribosomal protein S18 acetylase RimI-like enzyme
LCEKRISNSPELAAGVALASLLALYVTASNALALYRKLGFETTSIVA